MPPGSTQLDERPSPDRFAAPPRRWLGFAPRTVMIVGVLVATVMVAEYVWLYAPFGSDSATVSTPNATVDSVTDPALGAPDATVESTPDSTPDSTIDPTAPVTPGGGVDAGSATAPATYTTLGNVIIRSIPARAGAGLGKIPKGTQVTISCVATGEPVAGATKVDDHWDKVTYGAVTGYVSNTLMATGAAVDDPTVIAPC